MSLHFPVQLFQNDELVHSFKLSLSNWSGDPSEKVIVSEAIEQTKQDAEFLRTHSYLTNGKPYPTWDTMKVTTRPGKIVTVKRSESGQ